MKQTVALLLALLLPHTLALANTERRWDFRVLLDDREVGHHSFRVLENGNERRVESDARFTVRFLFIDAYTYVHTAREQWSGDCLKALESRTDDNGDRFRVLGNRRDSGFALATHRGAQDLDGCVMSFAYWNPAMLRQARLLNVQTGELLEVRTERLGEERITVRGQPVTAWRYALHAGTFRIDVWYDRDNHWVRLESRTDGGRLLRYQL